LGKINLDYFRQL